MKTATCDTSSYDKVLDGSLKVHKAMTIDSFVPFKNHILVQETQPEETYVPEGKIVIPETSLEANSYFIVVKVHPDEQIFEVGDMVLSADSTGYGLTLEGRKLKILQYHSQEEGEILGHWPKKVFDKIGKDGVYCD